MIVKVDEYLNDKKSFFSKHNNDFNCETEGSSAEYYRKTYIFADNAIWYEVMRKVYEPVEIEKYFCIFRYDLELFETEYWSTDNADSKKYYEKWDHTN